MAQTKKDYVKQNIIDNAIKLFEQNGYANTTIKQIARASKISVGNIYKYFEDKHEILTNILTVEFTDELRSKLLKRGELSAKRIYGTATKEDLDWFDKEYYPFFIKNKQKCILLSIFSRGDHYLKVVNSIAGMLIDLKAQAFSKYDVILDDEFKKISTYITMSNVELYVRILSDNVSDKQKLKLLKLADEYNDAGIKDLYAKLRRD